MINLAFICRRFLSVAAWRSESYYNIFWLLQRYATMHHFKLR